MWEDDKDVNSETKSEPHTQLTTTLDTLVRPKTFDDRPIVPSAIITTSPTIQFAWGLLIKETIYLRMHQAPQRQWFHRRWEI